MALLLSVEGQTHSIEIVRLRPTLVLRVDGRLHEVGGAYGRDNGRQSVTVDGEVHDFSRVQSGDLGLVRHEGRSYEVELIDPRNIATAGGGAQDDIRAPMPGAVVSLHKQAGDAVMRGETLVTIESMKLQTGLVAPRDGVIAAMLKAEGETFEKGDVIARLVEPAKET